MFVEYGKQTLVGSMPDIVEFKLQYVFPPRFEIGRIAWSADGNERFVGSRFQKRGDNPAMS